MSKRFGSNCLSDFSQPYDLATERLLSFPKNAKFIQIERTVFEDLLRSYEEIEAELAAIQPD